MSLQVHICGGGHHLPLVMNRIRGTEEGQVWVPAVHILRNLELVGTFCLPSVSGRELYSSSYVSLNDFLCGYGSSARPSNVPHQKKA
jgi:hypothetical protein